MPAGTVEISVDGLANTRDLVAKIVDAAGRACGPQQRAVLVLRDSQVSESRVRKVFDETVSLFRPEIANQMSLQFMPADSSAGPPSSPNVVQLPAQRNVRYEMLRILLHARIEDGLPRTGSYLKDALGLSEHPIRAAGRILESAGLIRTTHQGRELAIEPWECTPDVLSKVDARPFRVRYRYRAGAYPLSADKLAERFSSVRTHDLKSPWAISGASAARLLGNDFDLSGLPRVDLVVRVPLKQRSIDLSWLHDIAPRIEREPNPLEQAPLVVEIIKESVESSVGHHEQIASHADIVLALLDQGLVGLARQFVARFSTQAAQR